MTRLSISDAATWAGRFLQREWPLAGSVALAFLMLPGFAIQLLVPAVGNVGTDGAKLALAMRWMMPLGMIALFGGATLTAMALLPGMSVADALRLAARRFWVVLAALLIVSAAMLLGLTALSFVGTLMGVPIARLLAFGVTAMLVAGAAAAARLMPLVPAAMVGQAGPIATLRYSWALTAGHFWRLLATSLLMFALGLLILTVARQTIGALALVIGMASAGSAAVVNAVATLLLLLISAAVSTCCYIFIAGIYRQLAGR